MRDMSCFCDEVPSKRLESSWDKERSQYLQSVQVKSIFSDIRSTNRGFHSHLLGHLARDLETNLCFEGNCKYGYCDFCVLDHTGICMISWIVQPTERSKSEQVIFRKLKTHREHVQSDFFNTREINTTLTGMSRAYNDNHQRQPLLGNPYGENQQQNCPYSRDKSVSDYEASRLGHCSTTTIDMEFDTDNNVPSFPKEKCKTLLAAIAMTINFLLTLVSLSLVHERLPNRDVVGPLPDIVLDNIPAYDWALDMSEYIIMMYVNLTILVMVLHKHRYIVLRRVFLIMSVLYLYRAVTMYITVLPVASKTYPCSPKARNMTGLVLLKRVLKLLSGFGLSVNGKHTYCGDFIYSGHTVVLVLCYLIVSEYTSKKLWVFHWIGCFLASFGVFMLELSHGHYFVDIVIAYFITTRLFWMYHLLANNVSLKQSASTNHLSRVWWFRIFLYFEENVNGVLPNEFEWPIPWLSNANTS